MCGLMVNDQVGESLWALSMLLFQVSDHWEYSGDLACMVPSFACSWVGGAVIAKPSLTREEDPLYEGSHF